MLPSTQLPTRPQRYDWIVTVCAVLLLIILVWTAVSNAIRSRISPELQSAVNAVRAGKTIEAKTLFDRAVNVNPSDPNVYAVIAAECQKARLWDMGVEYARRGVHECRAAAPAVRALLYYNLATVTAASKPVGWQHEALKAAEQAYELDPKNPEMQNAYGYLLADLGRSPAEYERAERLISEALRTERERDQEGDRGSLALAQDSYGWVRYRRGDYTGAISAITQAIDSLPANLLPPEDAKALYYHLGAAYRKTGHYDEARHALQIALACDPKYAEAQSEMNALPAAADTSQETTISPMPSVTARKTQKN